MKKKHFVARCGCGKLIVGKGLWSFYLTVHIHEETCEHKVSFEKVAVLGKRPKEVGSGNV